MSRLYPDFIKYFATLEEAIAYANEVAGYNELWEWIAWADLNGVIGAN